MSKPLTISIALCTYNGEKYIVEQLNSLIKQTRIPDEIIISDDGSTDQTIDLAEEILKESKINYTIFQQKPRLGVFKNFPWVISKCSKDIIFPCDQDDIWDLKKLEIHMQAFENHDDLDLVFSNANVVGNDGQDFISLLWPEKSLRDKSRGQGSLFSLLYLGRSMAGCCMSFKKEFYSQITPIPDEIYHDDWIATSAAIMGKIKAIPIPLINYRQHETNTVGIKRGGKLSYLKSLFTNYKFYFESDVYLLSRHTKMYESIMKHHKLKNHLCEKELAENLAFQNSRVSYKNTTFINALKGILSSYHKKYYSKYYFGFKSFLMDCYRLLMIKLFN